MKTINPLLITFLVIACAGIVAFWVTGFMDFKEYSTCSFVIAGVSSFLFLAIRGIGSLRARNNPWERAELIF